tara:strand:+ start:753 stop:1031 length:279 start_codon:yes stop_codon:yes gene_type:complete
MSKPILEINGFTSKVDILTSIKEDIEDGNKDNAIDNLNQLIDYETKLAIFDYETKPRLAEDISKDKHQGRVDVHSHLDEDENGMSIGQGRLW